jgi:hypothetical protein
MLRRPKCSKNEVVAPKKEEEDMNICYRPILKKKTSKSHKLIHIP